MTKAATWKRTFYFNTFPYDVMVTTEIVLNHHRGNSFAFLDLFSPIYEISFTFLFHVQQINLTSGYQKFSQTILFVVLGCAGFHPLKVQMVYL